MIVLKKIEQNNNKLKQAIVISIMLHIILFSVIIWSSLDKHLNVSASVDEGSTINAVIVDPDITSQDYNHQQQENTNFSEEKDKKQQQKRKKELLKGQEEKIVEKNTIVSREKSDAKPRGIVEIGKKTARIAKKTAMNVKKIETEFKKRVTKEIVSSDADELFSNLNSDKNAPKTGDKMKKNNVLSTVSENTKKNGALNDDIRNYAKQVKLAIESHFYNVSLHTGKTCTLRIKLAPDGTLLNIESEGGNLALCNAALAAARQAKIPKPPSQSVYGVFKNVLLDFKP